MIRSNPISASISEVIPPDYVPVREAANKSSAPLSAIHRLIHSRAIPYLKIGRFYFVPVDLEVTPARREWDERIYWMVNGLK